MDEVLDTSEEDEALKAMQSFKDNLPAVFKRRPNMNDVRAFLKELRVGVDG